MASSISSIRNPEEFGRDLDIANEIVRQLGGSAKLKVVIRARNFTSIPSGVTFSFSGSRKFTRVRITLQDDLYKLHFYKIRSTKLLDEKTICMVYAENLRAVFEETTERALGGTV